MSDEELIEEFAQAFLQMALDIEYRVAYNGTINEIVITVTTGGPHIDLHLGARRAVGYWDGDEMTYLLTDFQSEIADVLFEMLRDMAPEVSNLKRRRLFKGPRFSFLFYIGSFKGSGLFPKKLNGGGSYEGKGEGNIEEKSRTCIL